MRANPGGLVASSDVIGRDELIARIWRDLHGSRSPEGRSLQLLAERRMGKSTIIRKMADEHPSDVRVLIRDVAGIYTTLEFVSRVLSDAMPHLNVAGRTAAWLSDVWTKFGGTEIAGVIKLPPGAAPHWKEILERVVQQLGALNDRRFVLIWDEFPLMIQNIGQTEGLAQAKALLDTLRALRQSSPHGPRMIFTGSIGLHHVIKELREDGKYANSPLNDMIPPVNIPPLAQHDAQRLATALFEGESLGSDPGGVAASHLAQAVDGVAFYIHQVAHSLALQKLKATSENVDFAIEQALIDPHDGWDLGNFRTRLKAYYEADEPVANVVLEEVALAGEISIADLHAKLQLRLAQFSDPLSHRIVSGERAALSGLLSLMMKDHYFERRSGGSYYYRFNVLRRWWLLQ